MNEPKNEIKEKIRELKEGNWFWVNKDVLVNYGRKLGPFGISVYNALAFFSNSNTQKCFPTHKKISELTGIGRRTVSRKIRMMEEMGLIKRVKVKGKACTYFLLKPKVEGEGKEGEGDGKEKGDDGTEIT